jgi:hypothetical protein
MAIKALRALQQFVIREIFKEAPTGVMRTLPNQELVDMNVQILAQRLMQGGIDPTKLKNANQVENAINMIESRPPVQQGITSTKSAKVFDMEGKEIPKGSKIMGGKAVKETEAEIAERIKRENKEAAERMRNKKFLEDYETSEAKLREKLNPKSTTSLDDPIKRVYEREKKEGKFENIRLRDGRKIESEEDFREYIDELNEDSNFATGGRAGFDNGGAPSIKLFPRAKGMETEQRLGPRGDSPNLKLRELDYGITGLIKGDKFFGGAEIDKGKVKIDVTTPGGDTLFKDTISKKDAVNFILGMGDPQGDKFQIKTDKDLENMQLILKKSFADGGRASFDEGGMTRRTFLKILGGLASIPIVGKILKPIKTAKGIKSVPIIKTAPVEGKPEWFDSLVNKVIAEGDDMTKQFATKEREIVHATKIDEDTFVRVTQDLDEGSVRVEYENPDNVFGDPVQMEYKRPLPDEATPDPRAEFTTAESGPVGRSSSPDDYDIDVDEVGGTSIRDLDSDVSKLKEYATGKKPTIKEMMQNKRRKDKARAISEDSQAQSDAVVRRQGDFVDDDFSPDFASGGIAGMLGE